MTRDEWIKAADAAYDAAYGANDVNYDAAHNAAYAANNAAYEDAYTAYTAYRDAYRAEIARIEREYPS